VRRGVPHHPRPVPRRPRRDQDQGLLVLPPIRSVPGCVAPLADPDRALSC